MTQIESGKLDKSKRDALPEDSFAVPGKRKLPIHDEKHVRMAWDMIDRTAGLTPEERSSARGRILRKAKELGLDTSDWHKMKAMAIEAMALNISPDDGHPNKMPFSGILVRLDEPSDAPPGGASGRRIIVSSSAAEKALETLLGMAVDFTSAFDGHDTQAKIGIITSASIEGNAIVVEGFVYAADFPEVAATIKTTQSLLGFSFEAQRIVVEDPAADILTITEMAFTGAAILRKDKAAYTTTSLAASAANPEIDMTPEELKAMLGEALAPLTERLDKIEAEATKRVEAATAVIDRVEPHASALEACHASMEAAGIGMHPEQGHVIVLKRMVGHMRAAAAVGQVPHIFRDHDYPFSAAADDKKEDDMDPKVIQAAVEAAVKPLLEKHAALETQIADLKAAARSESPAPERKTVAPAISSLLAKAQIALPEGDEKLSIQKVDAALKDANLGMTQRIMVKDALSKAGAI